MEVQEARYEGVNKFMWDGQIYQSAQAAEDKKKEYQEKNFEVRIFEQEDKHLVYTRRVVTDVVVEGTPPA